MTAAPGVFDGAASTAAVLMLLLGFLMLRAALLRTQIRLYAIQSLVLSGLAVIVAADRGIPELYALAALSALLKVVLVPWVMLRFLRTARTEIAGSGALGVASAAVDSVRAWR
jgi:hydrogenase-4 component E